jgi:hypothetical protein
MRFKLDERVHLRLRSNLRSSCDLLYVQFDFDISIKEEVTADSKKKRGGVDRALIALTEKYEVSYWSKKLKVTPAKLKYAVKKAGHSAKKVEAYIQEQKHRTTDKSRVAISQPYEVRYWSKKFKITPAKLKSAVAATGHSSKRVISDGPQEGGQEKGKQAQEPSSADCAVERPIFREGNHSPQDG